MPGKQSNAAKLIAMFPEMREHYELNDPVVQNACVMGATALGFLYSNEILGFAFYRHYGFTRDQMKAALIVLAALGKVDET